MTVPSRNNCQADESSAGSSRAHLSAYSEDQIY